MPAVLAVTGIVTIIFLVAMTALYSLTAEAASARARIRFLQRALTAEAALSYMVATEPASRSGLSPGTPRVTDAEDEPSASSDRVERGGEIRFDGRDYLMGGERDPVLVSIQDQAGLINLAHLTPRQASRLASRLGAPASLERWIGPRFLDYVDGDNERRLDGAEAADYPSGGSPANRELRRTDEWLSILGVRDSVGLARWRAIRGDLTLDRTFSRANANTASAPVLEVVLGISRSNAEAIIRRRDQSPILGLPDLMAVAGVVDVDPDETYTFPADRSVITLRDGLSSWVYRANIVLTPSGLERPLWIEQSDMLEAPGRQAAEIKNVPRLPYTPH